MIFPASGLAAAPGVPFPGPFEWAGVGCRVLAGGLAAMDAESGPAAADGPAPVLQADVTMPTAITAIARVGRG